METKSRGLARGYRDLIAWQKAMDVVDGVYEASGRWPRDELFGLINQVRRAAVSIPANIAEGKGRSGTGEFLHHLSIAHGSLCEVETHLLIAGRRRYTKQATLDALLDLLAEVGRLIRGLIKRFRGPNPNLT